MGLYVHFYFNLRSHLLHKEKDAMKIIYGVFLYLLRKILSIGMLYGFVGLHHLKKVISTKQNQATHSSTD